MQVPNPANNPAGRSCLVNWWLIAPTPNGRLIGTVVTLPIQEGEKIHTGHNFMRVASVSLDYVVSQTRIKVKIALNNQTSWVWVACKSGGIEKVIGSNKASETKRERQVNALIRMCGLA
jgi:hypothetical protein